MSDIDKYGKDVNNGALISDAQTEMLRIMIAEKKLPAIEGIEKLTYDQADELIQRGNEEGMKKNKLVPHTGAGQGKSVVKDDPFSAVMVVAGGTWTHDQVKLIKEMAAPNCTWDEFKVLLYQAVKYHLDPLTHEIWAVKYSDKPDATASIFAGFAGILRKAAETGRMDGFETDTKWSGKDGSVADGSHEGDMPLWVDATVYRKEWAHPVKFRAYLRTFRRYTKSGEPTQNWRNMPEIMLRKCALVNALRQAFPEALGGLYIPEETTDA